MASQPLGQPKLAYVRPVQPLFFPEQEPEHERLGQHPRHYDLCRFLYEMLAATVGDAHGVACDMFVYWVPTNPRQCRAPDASLKLGLAQRRLVEHPSWKTWELGAPDLAVEILSLSDTRERWTLDEKRDAYRDMGVREFVAFDLDAPVGQRLRAWDHIEGDFVERIVDDERTPCLTVSAARGVLFEWCVAPIASIQGHPTALRLSQGGVLVPTHEEARAAESARAAAESARADAAEASAATAKASEAAAMARVAELEALLRTRP
ncbi:MAG: Uma2 family endonuclease [Polyangiaceae bacterium]